MRFIVLLMVSEVIIAAVFLTRVPVHWQASYPNVPYDKMIGCLEQTSADTHTVGPRAQEHTHTAMVPLYERGTIRLVGQYEVQQSGAGSSVTWRDVKGGLADDSPLDRLARERADKCAKTGS